MNKKLLVIFLSLSLISSFSYAENGKKIDEGKVLTEKFKRQQKEPFFLEKKLNMCSFVNKSIRRDRAEVEPDTEAFKVMKGKYPDLADKYQNEFNKKLREQEEKKGIIKKSVENDLVKAFVAKHKNNFFVGSSIFQMEDFLKEEKSKKSKNKNLMPNEKFKWNPINVGKFDNIGMSCPNSLIYKNIKGSFLVCPNGNVEFQNGTGIQKIKEPKFFFWEHYPLNLRRIQTKNKTEYRTTYDCSGDIKL